MVIDDEGKTPFFHMDWHVDPRSIAQLLHDAGIDVNHQDHFGNTALLEYVHRRKREHVRALLDIGADPMIKDESGQSALDHAKQTLSLQHKYGLWDGEPVNPSILNLLQESMSDQD